MPELTSAQADEFLRGLHVGVLAIERKSNPPLAVPIWYDVDDAGNVVIGMGVDSLKGKLLRRAGRATFTVQREEPPYEYVSVEGSVTFGDPDRSVTERMAKRYLGDESGTAFMAGWSADGAMLVTLATEKVRSFVFTE
ncbi:pyridoxamine 5'-phosphate oxidase family protein [Gordonia humi]|uniref:Pyridoxamine 5'-phosphate oxidase n=1 Tax=Gordonia humi TaxID=686429 RepID=A0A840F554_9ACTN|nr:pyridoxamine 5'-phosphate oxidase family protein [Gordonia humi]MBB4135390.1 hypothetical protein [Gordonia humi]